jgi:N-acetylmuramoyl-L-alanine amidase
MTVWLDFLDEAAQAAVAGAGLPAAKVIAVPGWGTRGHGAFPRLPTIVVGHHTGTPVTARGDYPTQGVVTTGRSDLAGPLCNVGLGRNGSVYLIAAGVAWHAGASAFAGLTDLNSKSIGIEAEASGSGHDWTQAQLTMYPRLVAELLRRIGQPASRYVSHRGCAIPAGRKSDPAGISDDWMRARVVPLLAGKATPPAPPPPPLLEDYVPENFPVTGSGSLTLVCPVGSISVLNATGWVSAVANGGKGGRVRVFFQGLTAGISDLTWNVTVTNGLSSQPEQQIPDGCTKIVVQYQFDVAGTIALQVKPK